MNKHETFSGRSRLHRKPFCILLLSVLCALPALSAEKQATESGRPKDKFSEWASAVKDGQVRYVTIESEKGRDCTLQNPWPGKPVTLSRNNKKAETLEGNRFTFKTARGERIALVPRGETR